MFEELNDAQLLWYQTQIFLDDKEQYETLRNIAEHNAMFTNPEGVQQVRDARDNSFETPDEDFNQLLEDTFGRSMPEENSKKEVDVLDMLKQERATSKYSQIVDMDIDDFDEIKFTPFE